MKSSLRNVGFTRLGRSGLSAGVLLLVLTAGLTVAGSLGAADRGLPARFPVTPLPDDYRAVFASATSTDPIGDTLTPDAGADITRLTAEFSGGTLALELAFDGPIDLPGSDSPNAVDIFIDIDADRDGNTGMPSWTDTLRELAPADGTGLGIEYYVDFLKFDPQVGTAELYDDLAGVVVAEVPATFGPTSVTVQVPLALIGGSGDVHVAAVVYQTTPDNVFDAVPNQGFVLATEGAGDGSPGVLIDTGDTSPCTAADPAVLCLEDERFDYSVPGILKFDFTLIINPEMPL